MVPLAVREVLSRRFRRVSFYFVQSEDLNAGALPDNCVGRL